MPLPVLLALVLGGISAIALILHLLGLSARARIAGAAEAMGIWNADQPNRPARRAHLAPDGTAALIETDRGPGLVFAMGADLATRPLDGATLRPHRGGLTITLPDFTAPRLRIALPDPDRDAWARRIPPA